MELELLAVVNDVIAICDVAPQHVDWAGYQDPSELLEDLRDHARRLRAGDTSRSPELRVLFLPSGPLQDVAIDGDWHNQYMMLARRVDELLRP